MTTVHDGSIARWSDVRLEDLPLRTSAFDVWADAQGWDLHRTVVQTLSLRPNSFEAWEVLDPTVSLIPVGAVHRLKPGRAPSDVVEALAAEFSEASPSMRSNRTAHAAPQLWRVLAHMAYWHGMSDMAMLDATIAQKQAFELVRCRTVFKEWPIDEGTYLRLCDAYPQRGPEASTMSLDGFHAWWGSSSQTLNTIGNALSETSRAALHAQLSNVEDRSDDPVTRMIYRTNASIVAQLRDIHPLHHQVWTAAVERWYLERVNLPQGLNTLVVRRRL